MKMNMIQIALALPVIVYAAYLGFVIYKVEKNQEASRAESYALGSGSYRKRIIFFTLTATMLGPTFTLGVVDSAFTYGFYYTGFFLLAMVQFFVTGKFFAGRMQSERGCRTVGDAIGRHYDRTAQFFTGVATVLQMILGAAALCLGGAMVLEAIWNIPQNWGAIIVGVAVAAYSLRGGMPAVVRTDRWQFIWMFAAITITIYAGFKAFAASPAGIAQAIPLQLAPLAPTVAIGLAFAFLLGEAFNPVYSVRAFMSEDPEAARSGFYRAGWFGVAWFICLGLVGAIAFNFLGGELPQVSSTLLVLLAEVFGAGTGAALLMGIVTAGILGLVMSTLDSALNAAAVSLSRDLLGTFTELTDDESLRYSRIGLFAVAFAGIFVTFFMESLVPILILAYNVWVPTIVFPFAYSLLRPGKIRRRSSAAIGIVGGIIGFFVVQELAVPYFPPILAGLVANAATFLIADKLFPADPPRPKKNGERAGDLAESKKLPSSA